VKKALIQKQSTAKVLCRECHHDTKHTVLATHKTSETAEIAACGKIWWEDTYEMVQCCGCETVSLRHTHNFSEEPEPDVRYYPPAVSRPMPPWRSKLKNYKLRSLLEEVYSALGTDCKCLATMGARTVVDMVLTDKVGEAGTFAQKLEKLEQAGFVSRQSREFLNAALDAGNAAAHRGFQPNEDQLNHVMDIVENVLQAVYVLQEAATELRKTTPPRP